MKDDLISRQAAKDWLELIEQKRTELIEAIEEAERRAIREDIGRNGIANTPQLAELSEIMEVVEIEAQR